MQPEDAIRLGHMVEAAEIALRFVEGRGREELEGDKLLALGLARALEILGEAASKVTSETRTELPQIPWAAIIGMRNRLAHAYFDINLNLLWKTVAVELPRLLPALQEAIR